MFKCRGSLDSWGISVPLSLPLIHSIQESKLAEPIFAMDHCVKHVLLIVMAVNEETGGLKALRFEACNVVAEWGTPRRSGALRAI